MRKPFRAAQAIVLTISILFSSLLANGVCAGPIYGMKGKPSPEFDRTTRLFTPDGYHNLPAGRAGGTIGLAVIPKITANSDGAERAIAEVVGHIPSINMVISLPPDDPLYLFKFLKHLKESGRKVDVLMIAGHALQKIENDDVFAIKLGDDQSQWLTPASLNAANLAAEIEKLGKSGETPEKRKQLCQKLQLIHDGSAAMVPGAQLILHSCYLGHEDQARMLDTFASAFLGVNGGTAVGPKYAIASAVLAKEEPSGFWATVGETMVTRSKQICRSIKDRTYIKPGDAFINTQFFTETSIAKGRLKLPCVCQEDAASWQKMPGLWLTNTGTTVRITCSSNSELTGTIMSVPADSPFQVKPGDKTFQAARPTANNAVHSDNGFCYPKKGDKLTPRANCPVDLTISADGKTITGTRTLLQYYDGSTTWDAGSIVSQMSWKRIGD